MAEPEKHTNAELAAICRRQAALATDQETKATLLSFALDYEAKAALPQLQG